METEIVLPDIVPVMTLPEIAFFPQALLPLHIFEARYRQMLQDVLATDRLFAIAGLDFQHARREFEPPFRIAGLGMVRACQKNDNGTSNLLIQGLSRVEIVEIVTDEPYRRVRIRALTSEAGAASVENRRMRDQLARLLVLKTKLDAGISKELTQFLNTVDDPETFVDIAAFNLCQDKALRQRLLSTLNVHRRFELFARQLRSDIDEIKLRRKLQGGLADDQIAHN
jgi:Lon protease-like protein